MIERIQTGLTRNYVQYWTVRQALKEAAQNIAYGATKCGVPAKLDYIHQDPGTGYGIMEDDYIGFEKRHLYLGESEQAADQHGLGNFGEGWKIFMLVCARNGLVHKVETVGFTFWGEMVPTPHGVDALTIMVVPNNRQHGTRVEVECSKEEFDAAIQSFAVLAGIPQDYVIDRCIIPDRQSELWVNGVRIEQGDNLNPLELRYAYNLNDRSVLNRDRSQVNTSAVYNQIRAIIGRQTDPAWIEEYIQAAIRGDNYQDVIRGPAFLLPTTDNVSIWKKAMAKVHGVSKPEKLVLSSRSPDIDKEAEYRGYTIIKTPPAWDSELRYMGFLWANDVVKIRSNLEEVSLDSLCRYQVENLKRAKLDTKRALGLRSITELPPIKLVKELKMGEAEANGIYDFELRVVYLKAKILSDKAETVRVLIHECMHWFTDAADNTPDFTHGFEEAILRLLGHLG